jgi:ubiquinone/menaquinone biosynthesis C-methylase UbiE
MPDELSLFQTNGLSWGERAHLGELRAVLSPTGSVRRNLFLHNIHAAVAAMMRPYWSGKVLLDFGCGTGRFMRLFGTQPRLTIGVEITPEMLINARLLGLPANSAVVQMDGLHLPLKTESVDMVWICGVLRYSLLVPEPLYDEIACELFRIVKPGGRVVNLEMYVDTPPDIFASGFERAGFTTAECRVVQRYQGRPERLLQSWLPDALLPISARTCARIRWSFDSAQKSIPGLKDYCFVWEKD